MRRSFRIVILCGTILAIAAGTSRSQTPELINDKEFRPLARAAVDSIYNFNFEAAEELLQPWQKRYPDHPLWMLMESMTFWWKVLSDLEDTSHDERFFYLMKRTDYEASRLLNEKSSHADGLIIKAVSNGYIARQYANRNEWLESINRARRALSAHEYLRELHPALADLKLAEGLKLYYSAYLPEAYPIVKTVSWFLPEGDKQEGLRYLRVAADSAIFARAEATYFLGNINYNYEKEFEKAARHFYQLYRKYPNNNYYARILVKSLYRMDQYEEALEVIEESVARWEREELPYQLVLKEELLNWKGRILEKKNEKSAATASLIESFKASEQLPRPKYRSFRVVSAYYLGQLHFEGGQTSEARYFLETAKSAKVEKEYQERAAQLLNKIRD